MVTESLRFQLCVLEVRQLSNANFIPEVPEGRDSGVITSLEALFRWKINYGKRVVSLWPENLLQVPFSGVRAATSLSSLGLFSLSVIRCCC